MKTECCGSNPFEDFEEEYGTEQAIGKWLVDLLWEVWGCPMRVLHVLGEHLQSDQVQWHPGKTEAELK